jgi:hypothetical protein
MHCVVFAEAAAVAVDFNVWKPSQFPKGSVLNPAPGSDGDAATAAARNDQRLATIAQARVQSPNPDGSGLWTRAAVPGVNGAVSFLLGGRVVGARLPVVLAPPLCTYWRGGDLSRRRAAARLVVCGDRWR